MNILYILGPTLPISYLLSNLIFIPLIWKHSHWSSKRSITYPNTQSLENCQSLTATSLLIYYKKKRKALCLILWTTLEVVHVFHPFIEDKKHSLPGSYFSLRKQILVAVVIFSAFLRMWFGQCSPKFLEICCVAQRWSELWKSIHVRLQDSSGLGRTQFFFLLYL